MRRNFLNPFFFFFSLIDWLIYVLIEHKMLGYFYEIQREQDSSEI